MKKLLIMSFMFVGLMGLQACSKEEKPKEEVISKAEKEEDTTATLINWTKVGNEAAAGAAVGSVAAGFGAIPGAITGFFHGLFSGD